MLLIYRLSAVLLLHFFMVESAPGRPTSPDEPPLAAPDVPHWPDLNIDPPTPPTPPPQPKPDAKGKLVKGQWYIVDFVRPMLIEGFSTNGGAVTITEKKGPLHVPASVAIGRKPDKDDPEQVTIAGPFVYIVKAHITGTVIVEGIPTLNPLDEAGKPIPFSRKDVHRATIDVDAGTKPPGPIDPPKPDDAITAAIKAAYRTETASDKDVSVAQLAAFYRGAIDAYVPNKALQTWGNFADAMQNGRQKMIGEKVPVVRRALVDQIFHVWPNDRNKPFDEASKQTAIDSMTKAATVLEVLK
jgi:hypothetical protein